MYQINRFTIINPVDIVRRESYNPYPFSVFTRCLKVDRARYSTPSSATPRISQRTQTTYIIKANHGERSYVHVSLHVTYTFLYPMQTKWESSANYSKKSKYKFQKNTSGGRRFQNCFANSPNKQ